MCPATQTLQSVDLVLNCRPAGQNEQEGAGAVFCDWYFPVEHGVQVNVLVSVPALQLRVPDPW